MQYIYRCPRRNVQYFGSVPYYKLYRYNLKHLYPNLNGYGDNGQGSLKLWQQLHTYWLPNSYWIWQEYVVSVMLISVLNIKVTCEWHKAIKLNYKNTRNTFVFVLRLPSISRRPQLTLILWRQSYRAVKHSPRSLHYDVSLLGMRSREYGVTDGVQYVDTPEAHTFRWPLSP